MKKWMLTMTVETDNSFDKDKLLDEIDFSVNQGNGVYVAAHHAGTIVAEIKEAANA
jgi:hypothetical protein